MPGRLFAPTVAGLPLGLGGAPLGNLFSAVDDSGAQAVMEGAWAQGCRTFDTAPHYGNGLSEHRVGRALRQREGFLLASKVGRLLRPDRASARAQNGFVEVLPFAQHFDYSRAGTRRSVEDSLQRLGLAHLHVAFVHDIDRATHGAGASAVLRQVLDETLPELCRLREEGLVGAVGLGVNDWQVVLDVLHAADIDALLLAGRYTLLDQSASGRLLPECRRRGVHVALGGVFNSGILATGVHGGVVPTFNYQPATAEWIERTRAIESVCAEFDVPLRAAALQFPLAHEAVEIVIVGARTAAEWGDCAANVARPIAPAFWSTLRARGLLAPDLPTPV